MIKSLVVIIIGWATIGLMIDGFTGWGDKGEYKKSFSASLIAIPIMAVVYILIGLLQKLIK